MKFILKRVIDSLKYLLGKDVTDKVGRDERKWA